MQPMSLYRRQPALRPHTMWCVLGCIALCLLLSACGFRLRGISPLAFDTLYTNISENTEFGAQLRRAITASSPHTRFVTDPTQAQAKLIQLSNDQSLRELSINAQGLVEEYELNLVFVFQLADAKGRILLPPTTLTATREIPYDPTAVQAKQSEIGTVFSEMQQSLIDRVVRRLTSPDVTESIKNVESQPVQGSTPNTVPVTPVTPIEPIAPPTRTPSPFGIPGQY